MKMDANDPRWTAYALGELEDEKERAEIEKILKDSEEMRLLVEDIRRTAAWLNDGLKSESPLGLTQAQRDRIESRVTKRRSWFGLQPAWALSATAVVLALALSVWMYQLRDRDPVAQMAEDRTDKLEDEAESAPEPDASGTDKKSPDVKIRSQSVTVVGEAGDTKAAAAEDRRRDSVPKPGEPSRVPEKVVEEKMFAVDSVMNPEEQVKLPPVEPEVPEPAKIMDEVKPAETDSDVNIPARTADASTENRRTESAVISTRAAGFGGNAAMEGSIQDTSGGALPGVEVTATNVDTGVETIVLTNPSGNYMFPSLQPGEYTVGAKLDGFQRHTKTNLALGPLSDNTLNFELAVAGMGEEVEVVTSVQDIITESSPSASVILGGDEVIDLPLIDNDVHDLVNIMGGVTRPPEARDTYGRVITHEADIAQLEYERQTFAGVDSSAIQIQQDGLTINDVKSRTGINSRSRINPEVVDELKAVLTPTNADNNGAAGQAQHGAESHKVQTAASTNAPGEGGGMGMGTGIGSDSGKGIGSEQRGFGGFGGGGAGGVTGGFVSSLPRVAPPPPPPPPDRRYRHYEEGRRYPRYSPKPNTEGYDRLVDNPFMDTTQSPLSTFSIDVDTASYANVRRFLEGDSLPPGDAVRIEELINYFNYDYEGPGREGPFAAHFEMTEAPWNAEHRLLRIGLKAKEMKGTRRPPTNLVFLIDVSGSMADRNKLPLVKESLLLLVDRLTESDRVSIVTYADSTRLVLPSTRGDQKWRIQRAIERLSSGGSTNGASGIQLAYETARRNFVEEGANRVILATDGDFNVGITSRSDLTRLIDDEAETGIFLSALGYGMGNYKDDTLELLANKGRGNYAYIDSIHEAHKVLVEQINATLVGVAKDVKIQVEFNPGKVAAYRLIGYEDRIMPKQDFNDDTKKAGVIGAGHAVTALYEIVPAGKPIPSSGVDPLRYQKPPEKTEVVESDETAWVKIRYKEPEGEESKLMEFPVRDSDKKFDKASEDFKFAASVAAFGMVLRNSPYMGSANLEDSLDWAKEGRGEDRSGHRGEFIRLLHRAIYIKH